MRAQFHWVGLCQETTVLWATGWRQEEHRTGCRRGKTYVQAPTLRSIAGMKEVVSYTPQFLFLFHCMGICKLKITNSLLLLIPALSFLFFFSFPVEVSVARSLILFHSCISSVVIVVRWPFVYRLQNDKKIGVYNFTRGLEEKRISPRDWGV